MKKFLAVMAIAGTLVACNDGADGASGGDSTTLTTPSTVDSTTVVAPADSTAVDPLVDTLGAGAGRTAGADSIRK